MVASSTLDLSCSRGSVNWPSQRSTLAFTPPAPPGPNSKKAISALCLPAASVTFNCALRIDELTSTHSHLAGRVKVKSPTGKVTGESARALAAVNKTKSEKSKGRENFRADFIMSQSSQPFVKSEADKNSAKNKKGGGPPGPPMPRRIPTLASEV